jgi:predicted lipoprotein with Yx(FWY)xxD motif
VATVRIPPVLRPAVGGEKELSATGASVGDILRAVAASHPDTEAQLFSADGELNRYVNVYLNDEDVRVLEGLETAAGSFTLKVQRNAHVTNGFPPPKVDKHEAIAIGPKGVAVYMLAGETTTHLLCVTKTTGQMCLTFWPPATVKSAKNLNKQTGISGKLGTFHRRGYGLQLELSGHPLYYFLPDVKAHNPSSATGDHVKNSGIWHVVTAKSSGSTGTGGTTTMTTTTGTTTTSPYPYP